MIHEILPIIAGELNEFLNSRFDLAEDSVVLGSLVGQDGNIAIQGENKIVVTLINIERDGTNMSYGGGHTRTNPPIHINLHVLFTAYFNNRNYAEALKFISGVIGFFQGKNAFDHQNTPEMPSHLSKIHADLISLDFRELGNLWSGLGAKYLPSVIYKFRTLDMDEDKIIDEIPAIEGIFLD